MHTYTRVRTHAHMHAYTHACAHTHIYAVCTHLHAYAPVPVHGHTHVCTPARANTHTYTARDTVKQFFNHQQEPRAWDVPPPAGPMGPSRWFLLPRPAHFKRSRSCEKASPSTWETQAWDSHEKQPQAALFRLQMRAASFPANRRMTGPVAVPSAQQCCQGPREPRAGQARLWGGHAAPTYPPPPPGYGAGLQPPIPQLKKNTYE